MLFCIYDSVLGASLVPTETRDTRSPGIGAVKGPGPQKEWLVFLTTEASPEI